MRIAVCLSGQLRNWKLGVSNQEWFWRRCNVEEAQVDYFVHTWTYSYDRTGISQPYERREVPREEYEEFLDSYNVVKGIFDDKEHTSFYNNDHWMGLFYSFSKSLELKKEYELENGFKYDVVIKSRPDAVFNPHNTFFLPHLQDGIIFTTHGGVMAMEFDMYNVNDCVFLGNSHTMDLLHNVFFYRLDGIIDSNFFRRNIHPLGPGTLLHEYMREFGITPIIGLGFTETLLKAGCPTDLDLHNINDFEKMHQYFRDWYTK